ncbi:MAG: hypothetical protein MZU84_06865 [Sphingobacterium sp.]|nr:hypothetical protein [Sphingobacterium sp.]
MNWGFLWPFIIIAIGAVFFVAMFAGGKNTAAFAIPGSIVGGVGLVLLFQNITQHWDPCLISGRSSSCSWALASTSWAGTAAMTGQKKSGMGVMKVGLILFIIFGAFFELIFSSFNNLLFPILLILLGGYLILTRSACSARRRMIRRQMSSHLQTKKEGNHVSNSIHIRSIASHRRRSDLAPHTVGRHPHGNLWALTRIWPYVHHCGRHRSHPARLLAVRTTFVMDVLIIGGVVLAIVFAPNSAGTTRPSPAFSAI